MPILAYANEGVLIDNHDERLFTRVSLTYDATYNATFRKLISKQSLNV